jgi:hypothetical protein
MLTVFNAPELAQKHQHQSVRLADMMGLPAPGLMFRRMEHDYFQFKAGTFAPATWKAYVKSFREDTFANPAVRAMWNLQFTYLNPKFFEYMQPEIEKAATSQRPNIRTEFEQLLAREHD